METAKWIRYGAGIPEVLAKCTHNKKWGPLVRMTITYYVDMYLDALVAWDYYQKGYASWAAVSGAIFTFFMVTQMWRSYRFATEHNVYLFRASVFMVAWNVFFSSDPPHVIDSLTTELLSAIDEEGLFEAPLQLSFQVYVLIFQWASIGSPDIVQYASISISIISMAYASVRTFDKPYIFLGLSGNAVNSRPLAPYISMRFFQLISRIVTLAFLGNVLEGSVFKCGLVLCGMVAVRIWMFRSLLSSWGVSRKREGSILASLNPHLHELWVGNIPPFAVILGSLVSDAFFGDAHFHEHLTVSQPSENLTTVKVVPILQQEGSQPVTVGGGGAADVVSADTAGGDVGEEIRPASDIVEKSPDVVRNAHEEEERKKQKDIEFFAAMGISIRRDDDDVFMRSDDDDDDDDYGPSSGREERREDEDAVMAKQCGFIECFWIFGHDRMRRAAETIRRKEAEQEENIPSGASSGEARRLLIVDGEEVGREVVRVTRGTFLIAVENCVCFLAASAKANQFDFDPTLIGRMALGVGVCMLLQGVLFYRVYYAPCLNQLHPRARVTAASMVFCYGLLVVAIMITAAVTGIGTSKCPEAGCGTADSRCIPLLGTYECRCGPLSIKKPGATTLKDICYAPCPETGCGHYAGGCLRQEGGTYECSCEQGGTLSGTLCHDPCPEEGCGFAGTCRVAPTGDTYECVCLEGVSSKKPGATPIDICHDPCPEEGCGVGGQCVALTDTAYQCVCDHGISSKKHDATPTDICHELIQNQQ